MADFGSTVKNIWMKGMEAIGNTATSIANNTKYKVDEMNMVNRRAEILADFGSKAYALWQKGERFPDELEAQLKELKTLDEKLNDMRAERYAGVKTDKAEEPEEETAPEEKDEEAADPEDAEDAAETAESEETEEGETDGEEASDFGDDEAAEEPKEDEADDEAEDGEVPVIKVEKPEGDGEEKPSAPLSDAINDLFEKMPSREEMESKVNSALDSLGESLQKFSKEIDQGLSSFTDQMKNDKE